MRLWVSLLFLGLVVPLASAQTAPPAQASPDQAAPPAPASSTAPTVLPPLTAAEAAHHIGENRTVCGQIVNEFTADASHGTPTFVDLDQTYPHQIFAPVIWGNNKDDVGSFPKSGKVCASGKITLYHSRPEILVPDWHSWYIPNNATPPLRSANP